jgi:MYXO-CTERM domain-containing protein
VVAAAIVLFTPLRSRAQTTAANVAKYGEIRQRLLDDFVRVGEGEGMSMPAQERRVLGQNNYIRWADATIRLGWYIGVLATEHYMRQSPERYPGFEAAVPEVDTADELAAALLALERLDRVADASFFAEECTQSEALNGFFIRDDVPEGFHENFDGPTQTRSDFLDNPPTLKEMSQDQVYHLLLGLALASHLVEDGVQRRGRDVRELAVELARRIVEHVAGGNWLIKNPACGDRNVARGPSALGYSPATIEAISFITDGDYVPETTDVARDLWELGRDPDNPIYDNADNLHMAMAVAAIGRGWGDSTLEVLTEMAREHDWYAYPLLLETLHRDPSWCGVRDEVAPQAERLIDELPTGVYPQGYPQDEEVEHSFTASNRFIRGGELYVGQSGREGKTYPGLDFMLLHNLHAIAAPERWEGGTGEARTCEPTGGDMGDAGAVDMGGFDDIGTEPDVRTPTGDDVGDERDAGPASEGGGCGCAAAEGGGHGSWLVVVLVLVALKRSVRRPGLVTDDA